MLLLRSLVVLFVCLLAGWAGPAADSDVQRVQAALARLPLHFEANQGQWSQEVRYAARSAGETLFFTQHGPVLAAGLRRVDISLEGANPTPAIEPLGPLPGKTSYFTGRKENWRAGVAQYQRVAYRSVYRGIDVIYYGAHDQLEYDLVLQPGA